MLFMICAFFRSFFRDRSIICRMSKDINSSERAKVVLGIISVDSTQMSSLEYNSPIASNKKRPIPKDRLVLLLTRCSSYDICGRL